jgi:hypothetical protein
LLFAAFAVLAFTSDVDLFAAQRRCREVLPRRIPGGFDRHRQCFRKTPSFEISTILLKMK